MAHSFWIVLLLVSWTCCLHAQISPELSLFRDFVRRYNKPYANDPGTYETRFSVFKESLRRQRRLNEYETENGGSAVYGVNHFSDLTPQEFEERYLSGLRISKNKQKFSRSTAPHHLSSTHSPLAFDWREKGVIGRIWNQEHCGSCWAFATVETIASRYAIQTGHLLELSAQQLISCDTGHDLDGCEGGALELAFYTLVEKRYVIVNASTYPFESGDGKTHTCKQHLPNVGLQMLEYYYAQEQRNETQLQQYLLDFSPLTVSVNARSWQDYEGGIIQHHCDGSPIAVDHAVQVVGYNLTGPVPYWIVRNTWGTDWGEHGYLRLKFGANMCGMTTEVAYAKQVTGVGL